MSSPDEKKGQEKKDDDESVDHLFIPFHNTQGELHACVNLLFCTHKDRTSQTKVTMLLLLKLSKTFGCLRLRVCRRDFASNYDWTDLFVQIRSTHAKRNILKEFSFQKFVRNFARTARTARTLVNVASVGRKTFDRNVSCRLDQDFSSLVKDFKISRSTLNSISWFSSARILASNSCCVSLNFCFSLSRFSLSSCSIC